MRHQDQPLRASRVVMLSFRFRNGITYKCKDLHAHQNVLQLPISLWSPLGIVITRNRGDQHLNPPPPHTPTYTYTPTHIHSLPHIDMCLYVPVYRCIYKMSVSIYLSVCIYVIYYIKFTSRSGHQLCRLKPNSHQTIFPTDFQRHPKIKKSVEVGRFLKKNWLV